MCGIAGFVTDHRSPDLAGSLRRMADTIAHRGPDDEGFFETFTRNKNYSIGLAHRRLSIIDIDAGHQPMSDAAETLHIVFNGEIYNFRALRTELIERGYRFSTSSDTEVILYAYKEYGEACVDHLHGMFAFAIWDASDETLFLARDRFGKKPLFIYQDNDLLVFASEVKALLQYPDIDADVNMQAVWQYLSYRYTPGPRTLFSDIYKLSPGSFAVWQHGQLRKRRYYSPPDKLPSTEIGVPDEPVNVFAQHLDKAVKERMVGDVDYGAFLSGGIDSSAIVGLMARHSVSPVKTFSVGFREQKYSELKHARVIAEQFGTDHHELVVSEQDVIDQLPKLVGFRDAPVSEPSDIPIYLLSVEASREVKMVLTGGGKRRIACRLPQACF